jgi:hypothetical protein
MIRALLVFWGRALYVGSNVVDPGIAIEIVGSAANTADDVARHFLFLQHFHSIPQN